MMRGEIRSLARRSSEGHEQGPPPGVRRHRLGAWIAGGGLLAALAVGLPGPSAVAQTQPDACAQHPDDSLGQFGVELNSFMEGLGATPRALPPHAFLPSQQAPALPPSVQLTNLPAVGMQGTLEHLGSPGSCIAWSFGYGLGGYTAARAADGSTRWDASQPGNLPSAAYLYQLIHTQEKKPCPQGSSNGYTPYLVAFGSPSTAQVPYQPDCCYISGLDLAASHPNTDRLRLGSFGAIGLQSVSPSVLKEFLASGMAIAFAGPVYQNFVQNPTLSNGVFYGTATIPNSGHGMLLIGYDDTKGDPSQGLGAFWVQNSFGAQWPPAAPGGRFWLSYQSFKTQLGGVVAYPLDTSPLTGTPVTATDPSAPQSVIPRVFQWVDPQASGPANVHLVVMHRFAAPVNLVSVVLSDATGRYAAQSYRQPMNNGYSYFTRQDGSIWQPGTYTIAFQVTTLDGKTYNYAGPVSVAAPPAQSGQPALPAAGMPASVLGSSGQAAILGGP
jgi:hypothetical protein